MKNKHSANNPINNFLLACILTAGCTVSENTPGNKPQEPKTYEISCEGHHHADVLGYENNQLMLTKVDYSYDPMTGDEHTAAVEAASFDINTGKYSVIHRFEGEHIVCGLAYNGTNVIWSECEQIWTGDDYITTCRIHFLKDGKDRVIDEYRPYADIYAYSMKQYDKYAYYFTEERTENPWKCTVVLKQVSIETGEIKELQREVNTVEPKGYGTLSVYDPMAASLSFYKDNLIFLTYPDAQTAVIHEMNMKTGKDTVTEMKSDNSFITEALPTENWILVCDTEYEKDGDSYIAKESSRIINRKTGAEEKIKPLSEREAVFPYRAFNTADGYIGRVKDDIYRFKDQGDTYSLEKILASESTGFLYGNAEKMITGNMSYSNLNGNKLIVDVIPLN